MVIILIFKFLIFSSQVPIDEKSHQWFGATVASSGEDGVVVVSFDNEMTILRGATRAVSERT